MSDFAAVVVITAVVFGAFGSALLVLEQPLSMSVSLVSSPIPIFETMHSVGLVALLVAGLTLLILIPRGGSE